MNTLGLFSKKYRLLVYCLFAFPSMVFGAQTINSVTANPSQIQVNTTTQVLFTSVVSDPSLIQGSVNLQRRGADGKWAIFGVLHDDGVNGDAVPSDGTFSLLKNFDNPEMGNIHLRVSAAFKGLLKRVFSDEFDIPVGVLVQPGVGTTIHGPGNTSVTIAPDSVSYEVLVGIAPVPKSSIVSPLTSNMPLIGAFDIIFEPTTPHLPPGISAPLKVSIPAPPNTVPNSKFIIAQQALIDYVQSGSGGLKNQLMPVDTAINSAGNIVTDTHIFTGILGGGQYAAIQVVGSGFSTGRVTESTVPRPGVVVSNSTNTLVSVTDSAGQYTLFINGGPFSVSGFDPFRGSSGSANGNIVVNGSTVTADISLTPLATPLITREGIRNGGFERGDISSWAFSGAAAARQSFGPTSTGVTIQPTEGLWMADINTGSGSVGETGSSLKQKFRVPKGVSTLRFNFNFVSEEFPEFVGSIYNDAFKALITTPGGQQTFADVSVNDSGGYTLIGDCDFPEGDLTCAQTGWRQGSVDLSAYAGTNTAVEVELLFSAIDVGDHIYDTHVLIDNIRFATVWVDANIVTGAAADQGRVLSEVLGATEILSQAGLNVRLRNAQTNVPGTLNPDVAWHVPPGASKGTPTADETNLLNLHRSSTHGGQDKDVNVYYVGTLAGASACAVTVGPDDYLSVNPLTYIGNNDLTYPGIIIDSTMPVDPSNPNFCQSGADGRVLAHELGHLLISPENAGDILEHQAGNTNFMRTLLPTLKVMVRNQSAKNNGSIVVVP